MRTRARKFIAAGATILALTLGSAVVPAGVLAAPAVVSQDRFEFTFVVTDLNICGDLGVFSFAGTQFVTVVEFASGAFQFKLQERGRYTLTFVDDPQETWEAKFVESITYHLSPNGVEVFTVAFNSFEGPIRIHETTTFVVGPDGTVRVDNQSFVVDACPTA
jgi:hypothetical protein